MFTEVFRCRLETGTHTRWAGDMDEDHLVGLLWAVGEYGLHVSVSKSITRQLDQHQADIDPANRDYPRARILLEVMSNLVRPWHYAGPLWKPLIADATRVIADMLRESGPHGSATTPIFSAERRAGLKVGKYSDWACEITEDRLFVVLSVVGEFGPLRT